MASRNEEKFPLNPASYEWYEQVGEGTSATVYRALCIPFKRIVAIKVLDMERCNSNLDDIRREAQTMSLIDHPNLLRAHCSFVVDQHLWVVMPYMGGGSCLHIMKAAFENGFEELVIASILREVLKALDYLHRQGHIHRDVKAGNILVDDNGAVKVADFGVSAFMFDMGDRQRSRNTFVGTPCWMAPEVMEQLHGYNFKADIWSFGITALELARGHAPFSKYPPMKVLLMTLQNAPPGLDYERDKRFSKSFKELISICLAKDPSKRPSAEKLLKHSFFKQARSNGYLSHILDGLPPLVERIKSLKLKEEHLLAQRKMSLVHEEEKSQNEYKRGISAWNFDLEELKAQAALIKDDEGFIVADEKLKNQETVVNDSHPHVPMDNQLATFIESSEEENHKKEMQCDSQIHGGPVSSFPPKVINGLRGQFDICEDDIQKHVRTKEIQDLEKDTEQLVNVASKYPVENILSSNSDDTSCNGTSTSGKNIEECREKQLCRLPSKKQSTGSLISNVSRDTNVAECCSGSSLDEKSRKAAIQQKGRFKVMAGSTDQEANKVSCTERRKNNTVVPQTFAANQMLHIQADTTSIPVSTILPHLQQLLHQNIVQSEMIANVTRHICQGESCTDYQLHKAEAKHSTNCRDDNSAALSNKECEYLLQINELESRLSTLLHEVQKWKLKNVQLEQQLKDKTSNGYRPRN